MQTSWLSGSDPRGTACFHAANNSARSLGDRLVLLSSATPKERVWNAVWGLPAFVRSAMKSTFHETLRSRSAGGVTAAWAPPPYRQSPVGGQRKRGEKRLTEGICCLQSATQCTVQGKGQFTMRTAVPGQSTLTASRRLAAPIPKPERRW